ncbi:hypothetical protein QBC39DRAFT_328708 [Podospora conica]|nr:hypothetical protein QBC39DRAFT_328708 [Schizothecium conicum]
MHLPTPLLLLLAPLSAHSLHLPPAAVAGPAPHRRQTTPTPDPHITDFRGWELPACTGENQGVQTVTQSQLNQCLAFPVVVRALTLNSVTEGCTVHLFGDAGCTGEAQTLSAQTSCASVVSSVERWKAVVVICAAS